MTQLALSYPRVAGSKVAGTSRLAADFGGCAIGIGATQQTIVRFMHRNDKTSVIVSFKF